MDTNVNRVYVNPNFNRAPNRPIYSSDLVYSNNHMYVNPNFTRNKSELQQVTTSNRKIYVNPNFIQPTNAIENNELSVSTLEVNYDCRNLPDSKLTINENSNPIQSISENSRLYENPPIRSSSKSRYRLVRKNDLKDLEKVDQVKESCTIKINKYKSIPFNNFRNNLHIVKNQTTKQITSSNNTNTSISQFPNKSCYKLVRHNSRTINSTLKLTQKSNLLKSRRNISLKLKVLSSVRKKNNIPCHLFTKYGMCLRNLNGTCEYLHDKKHVSLCRKFLKGICHDKQCLLSHELSSKKMPTCFFYLRGMCTKDDCPYLHVKLSEKTKICHDFLKGYCDKGDMCPHRHVRPQIDKISDKKHYTLIKPTSKTNYKLNISKSMKSTQLKKQFQFNIKKNVENIDKEYVLNEIDCRYFKDVPNNETALCEVLKPTRCKLGILPSFIHL